jgi:alkylation response protein AidB-like acyl-CoA dehydrogenase
VIVENGTRGLAIKEGPEFVGARGSFHGDMCFENCRIPKENLIMAE